MSKHERNDRQTEELLKMGDLEKLNKDAREHHQQVQERRRETHHIVTKIADGIRFPRRSD